MLGGGVQEVDHHPLILHVLAHACVAPQVRLTTRHGPDTQALSPSDTHTCTFLCKAWNGILISVLDILCPSPYPPNPSKTYKVCMTSTSLCHPLSNTRVDSPPRPHGCPPPRAIWFSVSAPTQPLRNIRVVVSTTHLHAPPAADHLKREPFPVPDVVLQQRGCHGHDGELRLLQHMHACRPMQCAEVNRRGQTGARSQPRLPRGFLTFLGPV